RRIGLHVSAHLRRDLGRGENLVAEIDGRLVGVPRQGRNEQVRHEGWTVQFLHLVADRRHVATISERVSDMDGRSATLSIGLPNFGGWIGGDWSGLLDLARAADDAGVDRIIVNDHVVMGRHTDAYVWGRFPTGPEAPWLEPFTC